MLNRKDCANRNIDALAGYLYFKSLVILDAVCETAQFFHKTFFVFSEKFQVASYTNAGMSAIIQAECPAEGGADARRRLRKGVYAACPDYLPLSLCRMILSKPDMPVQ